jgi:formylglycine-generating enzyme required for sulfatase activity
MVGSNAQPGQIFSDCSNCPVMVVIPRGNFLMGSSVAETQSVADSMPWGASESIKLTLNNEHPQHEVTINQPFAIGRYLVTRGEFATFVREAGYTPSKGCVMVTHRHYSTLPEADWQTPPEFTQTDNDPVVCVSWSDAQAYVAWLNKKLREETSAKGGSYHLPSEAEWEYAARAGSHTVRWWGDSIGANYADCQGCGSRWDDRQPSPVGSFPANPFGLFDMLGSVWEWTEDCWHEDYVGAPTDGSAWMAGEWCEQYHAMRGGSFFNSPWVLRPASRTLWQSNQPADNIGFRVAKTL